MSVILMRKEDNYFPVSLIYAGCLYAFYPTTDPIAFRASIQHVKTLHVKRLLPAHYALDIPVSLIDEIDEGFTMIEAKGLLKQGSGQFDFEHFSIHI